MILMDKGRIIARGKPTELFSQRRIVEESRLKIPQVTRVAWALNPSSSPREVPATLDEGCRWISSLLNLSAPKSTIRPIPKNADIPSAGLNPQQKAESAIEIRNLHHVFPGDPPVHALKGINLTFAKGEFVALLGQNGSGKTTLAFHLVGAEKPTNKDASILVNGIDVIKSPLSQVVRHINYLFQNPANQLFCQTFGQEVTFGPKALGSSPEEALERGRDALRKVGLEHLWEYYTLSVVKSLETLLSLASVLAMNPQILIADEPTGGLDYATAQKVMEILLELNREGRTIIVITHDMELAAKYCRRVVVLRRGEVWMDGTPKEVFGQPERLAETRLSPPQVTLLAQCLANYGFPGDVMSTEDFVALTYSFLQAKS